GHEKFPLLCVCGEAGASQEVIVGEDRRLQHPRARASARRRRPEAVHVREHSPIEEAPLFSSAGPGQAHVAESREEPLMRPQWGSRIRYSVVSTSSRCTGSGLPSGMPRQVAGLSKPASRADSSGPTPRANTTVPMPTGPEPIQAMATQAKSKSVR